MKQIDYKDVNTLRKLLTGQGKLFARGSVRATVPRTSAVRRPAVKRARYMALLPFTGD